jgi:hypothetical protein
LANLRGGRIKGKGKVNRDNSKANKGSKDSKDNSKGNSKAGGKPAIVTS